MQEAKRGGRLLGRMAIRILIADDNSVFRKALRQMLESVDQWEVVEARDGADAVSQSLKVRPDVIILDLVMPVKDGLTATREISKALPETPVLMCTMHSSAQLELEAQKAGARKILSKTDGSAIIAAVQQLLPAEPPSAVEVPDANTADAPAPSPDIDPENAA